MKPWFWKMYDSGLNTASRFLLRSAIGLVLLLILLSVPIQNSFAASVWVKQKSGTLGWLHGIYFLDQKRGWVVGSSGTFLSTTDGGENWKAMRQPTEDTINDLYFADEENGWLVCERSIYLLRAKDEQRSYLLTTSDGGRSWRRVNLGGDPDARLLRILFARDGYGWVFGEGGIIFATVDRGVTWSKRRAPTRHVLFGGAFLDPTQLWLVGSGATVIQTKDGGSTWRIGNVLGITESVRFASTSFVDKARGWAVGNGGNIFLTADGGRTWASLNSQVEEDLFDVRFLDASEGWASGANGTLIHTRDGGFHWEKEITNTTHPLDRMFFISRDRGWAVGFGGTILSFVRSARENVPRQQAPVLKGAGPGH